MSSWRTVVYCICLLSSPPEKMVRRVGVVTFACGRCLRESIEADEAADGDRCSLACIEIGLLTRARVLGILTLVIFKSPPAIAIVFAKSGTPARFPRRSFVCIDGPDAAFSSLCSFAFGT